MSGVPDFRLVLVEVTFFIDVTSAPVEKSAKTFMDFNKLEAVKGRGFFSGRKAGLNK